MFGLMWYQWLLLGALAGLIAAFVVLRVNRNRDDGPGFEVKLRRDDGTDDNPSPPAD
jgi:hypothetical protein